ncbi:MAG: BrnT family toxin [Bryobacteraceae bacterium]
MESPIAAFDWDAANIRHLACHAVSPDEAEQCCRHDPLIVAEQFINGEERYLALGETDAARRLAFVFTIRRGRVRFVTAYRMTPEQQELYEEG